MKKYKSKQEIEREYKDRMTAKQYRLNTKYRNIKAKELAQRDTYLTEKQNKETLRRAAKYEKKMQQDLKNFERNEKGNKTIKYKKKAKPITKTIVLEALQLLSRLRDADAEGNVECISCPVVCRRDEMHGGHLETRQNNATAFDMHNINAQSSDCNNAIHMGGINGKRVEDEYRRKLSLKIGAPLYNNLLIAIDFGRKNLVSIPDKARLQEMYDRAIEKCIKYKTAKNLTTTKRSALLDKVFRNEP